MRYARLNALVEGQAVLHKGWHVNEVIDSSVLPSECIVCGELQALGFDVQTDAAVKREKARRKRAAQRAAS